MNPIHRISYLAKFLAVLACTMLGFAVSAPAAFAVVPASNGGSDGSGVAPTVQSPHLTHAVLASGMPGWQIAMIVAVVAVLAAAVAIVVDRSRVANRTGTVPAT
jgi:hypothetical protein